MSAPKPKKLISICIPVLNEEDTLDTLYETLEILLAQHEAKYEFELIFTDNHSTDQTFEKLHILAQKDPRVRVFRFSRNFGYQRSILTAYLKSRGDAVVQLDCDLQDPPELIFEFLTKWEEGYDVVYGIRKKRDEHFLMETIRKVFYRLANFLSEDPLPVDAGDFRLADRKIVRTLGLMNDSQPYLRGAISAMGFSQLGIPYERRNREAGTSKFSVKDLFGLALDGILNHSTVPLRVATFIGMFVAACTLFGVGVFVVAKVAAGATWPAGFATLATLILASMSLNALFLGIIGEYLGRIYKQVKRGPLTVIEASIDSSDDRTKDLSKGMVVEP
ncbi:MAG: glycosyltransferase [Myxococcales bacterium]|nr:glycosyltransferase [Myxococcales bacterium]